MTSAERRRAALVILDAGGVEAIEAMMRDRAAVRAVLAAFKADVQEPAREPAED